LILVGIFVDNRCLSFLFDVVCISFELG